MKLNEKIQAALRSREERQIRRRLPSPTRLTPSTGGEQHLVDFNSNDYLSLASHAPLRERFLRKLHAAPDILGSGGSRLLVNGTAHHALEARLAAFFDAPAALLFNSGFDANAGFFACIPQPGDAVVFDEHIHASVHDGLRASRAGPRAAFAHNSVSALRAVLERLLAEAPAFRTGGSSVFIAVEALYSMDGTFAPLPEIVALVEAMFSHGNGYIVVDEAHATGLYGPQGRGLTAYWGLETRVLARLHTFGKALAGNGAVVLTTPLLKDYMLNYARPLIYTTSLNNASIIATDCSFDMLEDGTAGELSEQLKDLIRHALVILEHSLKPFPAYLVSLPSHLQNSFASNASISAGAESLLSPIVPIMSAFCRPLATHLRNTGFNARPITWPTVPKGKDRVRICLHAGNTKQEVDALVCEVVRWAEGMAEKRTQEPIEQPDDVLVEAKL